MSWDELAELTRLVRELPADRQQSVAQMSQIMVSAHSTLIEGSRVTVAEAFNFLGGGTPQLSPGKGLISYDMLGDHACALRLASQLADERQLPTPALIQQLAAAVMASTAVSTNTILGEVNPAQGGFRRDRVFIIGASSFPSAQKIPALVARLAADLRQRMPLADALPTQLSLAFEAHQRLVSIHPFNDGNGRTSRLLMNYVQHYYGQPLTIVFREDKEAYFEALEASRRADDLEIFFAFMRGQHGKSLRYQLTQGG
ncbi:Fic family protein [uncultured Hymenobacter sp.]|uniref:Fic family protein n=1 Tax=uncultured Hymenobacter sp. TaxID=170016 RepID=UPI0035CA40BA